MNSSKKLNCRFSIIADDLTSATDGACPFLYSGHIPRIYCSPIRDENAQFISIDTNSRNLTETQAFDITFAMTQALNQREVLYKTVDSTLRGHIRAEILAAFQASKRARVVIAPAFPAAGRTTLDGIQCLNSRPVSTTSYGLDPVHPARTSHIADLIDTALGVPLIIPTDQDALTYLNTHPNANAIILDAHDQSTLNKQVGRIAALDKSCLWVGSPGMAQALAATYSIATPSHHVQATKPIKSILIVMGSANPVSHAQCDVLAQHGIPIVEQACEIQKDTAVVCLRAPKSRNPDSTSLLQNLVHEAQAALSHHSFDALVATGGETMAALLKNLDITNFTLTGEIESGFSVGTTIRSDNSSLVIAMKAGGFGTPQTLLKATQHFLNPLSPLKVLP